MESLKQESQSLDKLNITTKKIFMDKTGINETQLAKIEQLSKEGLGVSGTIDQDFSINIVNGIGNYTYSKITWWVTVNGYIEFTEPTEGTWHFTALDTKSMIFNQSGIKLTTRIPINYKTGFTVDLALTAEWTEKEKGTLKGHIHLDYY